MHDSYLGQRIKMVSLCGAGLALAILAGVNIGSANYAPLLFGAAIVTFGVLALFIGRSFWVLTIASSFLGGTFPILGGSFTPFLLLMAVGVVKFLIEDIVFRRTRLQTGNRIDLLLIVGFMGVLTIHALKDRFGMRFLGSNTWGGRNYIYIYVAMAAFFVIQSIPWNVKIWAKLPYFILAIVGFDLVIAVITTIFPGSIYKIYPFYSAVSVAGLEEIVTGSSVETARLGGFGTFGSTLIALVLASVSLGQILRRPILPRLITLGVGTTAVLFAGYRSAVATAVGVVFTAGIRDLKWAVVLLLAPLAALLLGLSVINSNFVRLPKQVQRSVAFFPGDWDSEMKLDAKSSNEFRARVWTLWAREYFPVHPLIGRGFGFRNEWAKASIYKYDPNADYQMVEVGNIHNGFLSALDTFGIVGTIFFVLWNLRLLTAVIRIPFRQNDRAGIPLRFLALWLGSAILCYWMSAANIGTLLPQEFALAAVFLRLRRESQRASESAADTVETGTAVHGKLAVA